MPAPIFHTEPFWEETIRTVASGIITSGAVAFFVWSVKNWRRLKKGFESVAGMAEGFADHLKADEKNFKQLGVKLTQIDTRQKAGIKDAKLAVQNANRAATQATIAATEATGAAKQATDAAGIATETTLRIEEKVDALTVKVDALPQVVKGQ